MVAPAPVPAATAAAGRTDVATVSRSSVVVRDEVTPRFPSGLTVWDAEGQWQSQGSVGHERTKVLLLVHPDNAAAQESVQAVIGRYRKAFEQESVLWETARVCAAL